MAIQKVLCCCGSGLGSSLIVHMNTEDVLKNLGHGNIEVTHSSLSDCTPDAADLFVVGGDLEDFVKDIPEDRKVILTNILDKDELETKLKAVLGD